MANDLDLRNLLTYKLVALSREISYYNQRDANPTGDLNIPEMRILSIFYSMEKASLSDFVKKALRGDPGNMSRYIKSLEQKGYLKSARDKEDKRLKWLSPTAKGKKTAEKYIQQRIKHNDELSREYTKKELTQLSELLDKAVSYYERKGEQ